jgi:multicomponent Na+:H+ antiporter subunit D
VGVYAIVRTQTQLFPEGARPATLLLVLAGLTMLVGILGAIAQDDVKRILSFNIVSHIGYMVMGLAFFTVAGLAAAILYVVHHIVAKTTLFLTSALIEHHGGASRLSQLGDMVRTAPVIAVLFLVPALSLAGIPPLSGFVPKLALVQAGLAEDHHLVVGVSLLVSLLTLYSLLKIWSAAFWNPATPDAEVVVRPVGRLGGPALMVAPTAALLVAGLAIAVAAGPLYDLSHRAAADLLDPSGYREAVLG